MDAYSALSRGEAAIIETDTVYGLAAVPESEGVEQIYRLKQRPHDQPLPWLISGEQMLERFASHLEPYAKRLAKMFWPGALTLVVESEGGTLALRCPDNAVCLELIERMDSPLACTSANVHGEQTCTKREDLPVAFAQLPGAEELPDECGQTASTIVDCTGVFPKILRAGPIPSHVIWDVSIFDDTLPKAEAPKGSSATVCARHACGDKGFERHERKGSVMRVAIGSDHGGFEQKNQIRDWLVEKGIDVCDFGCDSAESVDYPDFAKPVATAVASGDAQFGILVCGTGIGMALAANKVRGIRAANITSVEFAQLTREHNNANIVTLSGRFVSLETNKDIVETFLETQFAGGRHALRVDKIMAIEQEG